MPYDTKLLVIAKRSSQPMAHVVAVWTCLLDAASQHATRGVVEVDPEGIAVIQDIELKAVQAILTAFYAKGMLDEQNRLTGWNKRQHTTSTERSQKFRTSKRLDETPSNAEQQDATQANTKKRRTRKKSPDTEIDYRTDLEAELDAKKDLDLKPIAREEKKEREKEKLQSFTDEIAEQMTEIWNAEIQSKLTKGHKATLTADRKKQMALRWAQDFQKDMSAWRYFCEVISASDFCMGKIAGKGWTIDLSWAVESSEHVVKILEGRFSGGNHPPKPPACEVPELQQPWEDVLQSFQQRHGKSICRSWLTNTVIASLQTRGDMQVVVLRCPSPFVRQWIEQHYLADITGWWKQATANTARVMAVELTTQEQS